VERRTIFGGNIERLKILGKTTVSSRGEGKIRKSESSLWERVLETGKPRVLGGRRKNVQGGAKKEEGTGRWQTTKACVVDAAAKMKSYCRGNPGVVIGPEQVSVR